VNNVNQITAFGGVNLTYDDNGNMLSKGSNTFTWDYNNRLVGFSGGGKSVEYKYNYNDLRVYKESSTGGSTRFYYNGSQLVAEGDGSKITKVYTNDNEGVLGLTRYIYDGTTLKNKQQLYYLFDDLGSVVMITNHQGLPTQYYQYDAWGNITNASNDPINGLSFVGRYGGLKDWDTGLTYFWHRWYDSEMGRWISRDPIGVEGGINLLEYSSNNSINKSDPNGLLGLENLLLNPTTITILGISSIVLITYYTIINSKQCCCIYLSKSLGDREEAIVSYMKPFNEHVDKILGAPNSPNRNDWCKHMRKALNNMKRQLDKMDPCKTKVLYEIIIDGFEGVLNGLCK
jgi:RHS repeat-associated protein